MPSNTFKGVVQLSKEQFNTLKTNGSLTVGQDTLTYDPNATLYVTDMFIYVPTKTSDLINDSNFATTSQIPGIVDDLNSVDNTKSLSANQGRILNEKITEILNNVAGGVQSFTVQNITEMGNLFGLEISEQADNFAVGTNTITYDNKSYTLKNGDIFLIVDIGVPDYWFSSTDMTLYRLETNKVDLSGFLPLTAGSGKVLTGDLYLDNASADKSLFYNAGAQIRGTSSGDLSISSKNGRNIFFRCDGTAEASTGIRFNRPSGNTIADFYPQTTGRINIGTSSNKFNNIHGTTIYQNGKQVANKEDIPNTDDFLKQEDLEGKLDKVTSSGSWRTYAIDESGEQDTLPVAITETTANGGSIPTYMASTSGTTAPAGRLVTNDPTNDYHAATKKYVDNNYLPLTAGSGKPLTGVLVTAGGAGKIWDKNSGIQFGGNSYISGDTTSLGLQSADGVYFRIKDTTKAYLGATIFRPSVSGGISLGSDTYRFSSIHGTTIYQGGKQVANKDDIPDTSSFAKTSDIPTVNNGTLTIQQDGATLGTFTANQSGDTTINIAGGSSGVVFKRIAFTPTTVSNTTTLSSRINNACDTHKLYFAIFGNTSKMNSSLETVNGVFFTTSGLYPDDFYCVFNFAGGSYLKLFWDYEYDACESKNLPLGMNYLMNIYEVQGLEYAT